MGKQHIFFDLDGTLTDSMPGITRAVQYALKRYGIQVDDLNVLKPFVGPPLRHRGGKENGDFLCGGSLWIRRPGGAFRGRSGLDHRNAGDASGAS